MYVFIVMSSAADTDRSSATSWSTWEELLLAFAVKRHGLKDWDTVAMELQNRHHRSSLPSTLFTAQICKDKYRNLRRQYMNHHHRRRHNNHQNNAGSGRGGGPGGSRSNELPYAIESDGEENNDVLGDAESFSWLEELRKLRVAELKQEVQRYDVSIESLQMKVKTMEEDREKSLIVSENGGVNQPDLDEKSKEQRSDNDKSNGDKDTPDDVTGKSVSADDENRSFNESNSTENRRAGLRTEPEPEPEPEPVEVKPDPKLKPVVVVEEDSCNDSSDRHEVGKSSQERGKEAADSDELRDSVGESKEGTKESSDVQSSASLMTRKKRRGEVEGSNGGATGSGGGGGGASGEGATVVSPATAPIKREAGGGVKSEPLLEFLDNIRTQKHGSLFERRLESQKTEKYKSTIRQHMDLEMVRARIDDGSYSLSFAKFYVDLLLLFNNAIVFFPKSSPESLAAHELRQLVMKELKKNDRADHSSERWPIKPKPEPERPDSLLAQQKSSAPIIVCRKRSSISAKASSSINKVEKQNDDKTTTNSKPPIKSPLSTSNEEAGSGSMKLKMKEKPVTGVRSMRRSNKDRHNVSTSQSAPSSNQNQSSSSQHHGATDKAEAAKVDNKKKSEVSTAVKKRGAADFLKRMKKNDPGKGMLGETLKSSGDNFKGGKRDQQTKKKDERKDGLARRSGGGGGKHTKEESSPSKRSVGRPPKKGKEAVAGKRGRDGGEAEGNSKRPKKRSRR